LKELQKTGFEDRMDFTSCRNGGIVLKFTKRKINENLAYQLLKVGLATSSQSAENQ
jgi:hypothetical protein